MDTFLLYKKNFEKNEGDILKELENIKKIGKEFYGSYIDYSPKFIFIKEL